MMVNNSNTRKLLVIQIVGFLMILVVAYGLFWVTVKQLARTNFFNYLSYAKDFTLAPTEKLISFSGRTNILLLGKSGQGYEAPDLTDTMILVSVALNQPSVTLISIPRDIWIASIRAKINSAYYWGRQDNNHGLALAEKLVEEVTGQPVAYGLVVDFSAFTRMIDLLGGVEVEVERDFIDTKYPIAGREQDLCGGDPEYLCRYETLRFAAGKKVMDGETALKFVRSRNSEGEEGTDLAREARQQKVVTAVKDQLLLVSTLTNPKKLLGIWRVVKTSIETDLGGSAGAVLVRKMFDARNKTTTVSFPSELLVHPPSSQRYDYQYVFIPKAGDWQEVKTWFNQLLTN